MDLIQLVSRTLVLHPNSLLVRSVCLWAQARITSLVAMVSKLSTIALQHAAKVTLWQLRAKTPST